MPKGKLYKVWTHDRAVKKLVLAINFEELIKIGRTKLGFPADEPVRVVIEYDGTEVLDQAYFSTLPQQTRFMFLRADETWTSDNSRYYDEPDSGISGLVESECNKEFEGVLNLLRKDITKIVTLNYDELEFLVCLDEGDISNNLQVSMNEAIRIKNKCFRYLDEMRESQDAISLLNMLSQSQNSQTASQEGGASTSQNSAPDSESQRKRKKLS